MSLVIASTFYTGVATLSLVAGIAALISPLGTGLFILGAILYANQNR